ncbi:MAG: hypothetical protein R3F59_37705 [Myxococcota bacterium]
MRDLARPDRPGPRPRLRRHHRRGEDDVPLRYRGAIDEGARNALQHGPTAGFPVVGAQLRLTGGAYDILQSTDDHFRLAGERAARTALQRAGTRVLEPWVDIEVQAPQQALGDLISDISAHRGRILGMEVDGPWAKLVASCPYRELRTFASRLRTSPTAAAATPRSARPTRSCPITSCRRRLRRRRGSSGLAPPCRPRRSRWSALAARGADRAPCGWGGLQIATARRLCCAEVP